MKTRILEFLKTTDDYFSGEELSRRLNISRSAVWKNIRELRKEGYDITAVPHRGYLLKSVPDCLTSREIQYNLKTKILGQNIIHFDEVSSTMDVAFQLGVDGAPEGTVVFAEQQTKGRGRLGRTWNSPKGKGIYCSMILRPAMTPTDVAKMTLLTAVAVCEAIEQTTSVHPRIKWPNDLLVGSKKIAGCLTELSAEMDRVRFVVVGVGINVNTPLKFLPDTATSLKAELKEQVNRSELVRSFLLTFETWYKQVLENGFDSVLERWKELSSTLGSKVRVTEVGKSFEGEAVGLDEYGGLIIKIPSGEVIKRMTGDVELIF